MDFAQKYAYLKQTYADGAALAALPQGLAAENTLTYPDCGGTFYIARIGGAWDVQPYDYHDNTVSIRLSAELLEALLQGKKNPVNEFMLGNIEAEGEPGHALALIDALRAKKRGAKKGG